MIREGTYLSLNIKTRKNGSLNTLFKIWTFRKTQVHMTLMMTPAAKFQITTRAIDAESPPLDKGIGLPSDKYHLVEFCHVTGVLRETARGHVRGVAIAEHSDDAALGQVEEYDGQTIELSAAKHNEKRYSKSSPHVVVRPPASKAVRKGN